MAGLATYRKKRRFDVTREPRGKRASRRGHAFVIQKHAARRLHYDLRLQLGGVMKSWAVTRGPSLVPGEKRLAVEVEDHPIEYNKFEGTIPKGEYGGGTVMIWDRGTWTPEDDAERGLNKGHLSFRLDGKKLHGGWHLVRMRKRSGEKRDNWLLIKQHDEAARRPRDKNILETAPLSVKSGRSMEEIAQHKRKHGGGASADRHRRQSQEEAGQAPMKRRKPSKRRKKPPLMRGAKVAGALEQARRAALPRFVKPCLATLVAKAPNDTHWAHEIKFDGYRIQARLDHGKVKLMTRKGLDWTQKFPASPAP